MFGDEKDDFCYNSLVDMIFTYDKKSDAAYLQLVEVEDDRDVVMKTESVSENINLDYDSQGRIFGIEFLNASDLLPGSMLVESESRQKKSA